MPGSPNYGRIDSPYYIIPSEYKNWKHTQKQTWIIDQLEKRSTERPKMDNVQYIKMLAADNGLPITDDMINQWDKLADRKEINKAFFSKLAETPKEEIKPFLLPENIQDFLHKQQTKVREEKIAQLKKSIAANMNSYDSYTRNANDYLVNACKQQKEIELYEENKTSKIQAYIEKAMQNPYWQFKGINENNVMEFHSSEVILRYINKEHKIDQTVFFGKFQLTWDLYNSAIWLKPMSTKYCIGNYAHPHVKSNGIVCLGNASELYKKAMLTSDIATLLEIYQAILTSYNPDSPYVILEKFYYAQNPHLLSDKDCVYGLASSDLWFDTRELKTSYEPRDTDTRMDNGEEFKIVQLYTYIKKHSRYDVRLGIDTVYYRANNGKYIEATEGMIYEY